MNFSVADMMFLDDMTQEEQFDNMTYYLENAYNLHFVDGDKLLRQFYLDHLTTEQWDILGQVANSRNIQISFAKMPKIL